MLAGDGLPDIPLQDSLPLSRSIIEKRMAKVVQRNTEVSLWPDLLAKKQAPLHNLCGSWWP